MKYSVGDAHPQDGASSDIATHISSVAEKVEWLDEQLRMFFRAADVIAVEVSDDVKSATTFVSSGVFARERERDSQQYCCDGADE